MNLRRSQAYMPRRSLLTVIGSVLNFKCIPTLFDLLNENYMVHLPFPLSCMAENKTKIISLFHKE